jgi:hypothetical protein
VLAPGGSFEPGSSAWKYTEDARIKGADPYRVSGPEDKRGLQMEAGDSATSPPMCVDLHYPTMRMFVKPSDKASSLRVEAAYPDAADAAFRDLAVLPSGGKDWALTPDVAIYPERGGGVPGNRRVVVRLSVVSATRSDDAGTWGVDDVYVDPRMR